MKGSIYSSKLELHVSSIHGYGTFAKENISKGELLFVKNGQIIPCQEKYSRSVIDCYWPIDDKYVLGTRSEDAYDKVKLFINHSCNPNCGLQGINTGIATRDIVAGEEITFDYAMLDNEPYSFNCSCGSANCRKIITGFDWKKPEIQAMYAGYFVDYLQDKIDKRK